MSKTHGIDTEVVCDSSSECPIITEEPAKCFGMTCQDINSVVSNIVNQVSNKKIQISLHQLLKIVKPEIQQDIINLIANPNITKKRKIPRKKSIFNNFSSLSSESDSGSSSESSNNDKDFTVYMGKAKKRD